MNSTKYILSAGAALLGAWVSLHAAEISAPTGNNPPTAVSNTVCLDGCTLPLGFIIGSGGKHYAVLSPWGEIDPPPLRSLTPRLTDLNGKTVGLFINMKRSASPIMGVVERRLKERYPDIRLVKFRHRNNDEVMASAQKNEFAQWVKGVDVVISAVGDCGSCTKFVAYNTVAAEAAGKPAVAVCNADFVRDARVAASGKGMPGLRLVAENVPPECTVAGQIEAGINAAMDAVVQALLQPLTAEEKSPTAKEITRPARIAFKGSLDEVNRTFYAMGWADGLPINPPTEEAVAEMLTGTDLPSRHVVAKLIPRMGDATVEKVAVNAVMAGCLPTHMPVLITGVRALADKKAGFGTTSVSTASWAPFWVINGPVRADIHLNSGAGALNPGDIANAAIGRALGLIIKNVGGIRKGVEDMGMYGNPGKYTMVAGENQEASPWPPLHVEQGFKPEESTVTLSFPTAFAWTMLPGSDAKSILHGLASGMTRNGVITILLNPQHAKTLADAGYTKEKIVAYICENGRKETMRAPLKPTEIRVMVAGGSGGLGVCVISGGGGFATQRVTHKIELPKNWAGVVAKYQDVMPHYATQ